MSESDTGIKASDTKESVFFAVSRDVVCSTSLFSQVPDALAWVINHTNVTAGICVARTLQPTISVL